MTEAKSNPKATRITQFPWLMDMPRTAPEVPPNTNTIRSMRPNKSTFHLTKNFYYEPVVARFPAIQDIHNIAEKTLPVKEK